jgi:putative membrane protein
MKSFRLGLKSLIFLSFVSVSESKVFAQWRGPGSWDMGPGMLGWGMLAWFAPLMMLIFWIAIILAIIFFIRWLIVSSRSRQSSASQESALEILKKRYARGEVGKEEFEEKKRDLL